MAIDLSAAWMTDGEFYKNYALIGFQSRRTGKTISFEMFDKDEYLKEEDREFIREFIAKKTTVGFYSNTFDLPLYAAACAGFTVADLKRITNDSIIGNLRPWELADVWEFKQFRNVPHIDLIEVAFGQASLKIYNGRLHGKRMQDLPYEPEQVLTDEEKENVFTYWKNDLAATSLLFDSLKNELNLRQAMTNEYRTDLMSKSDAQIAEAVMKAEIEKITGFRPERPTKRAGSFYYDIPSYINFKGHKQLEEVIDWLHFNKFTVDGRTGKVSLPEELLVPIDIGGRQYQMGIGGLHSKESCQHVREDNEYLVIDRDVESYYPRIIINQKLYPEHLGPVFLKVYSKIVNKRLREKESAGELKKARDAELKGSVSWEAMNAQWVEHQKNSDSLKITINGLFGKLGNIWSIVFSPKLLIQVTVTGQLSLLQFIWDLHKEGFEVVSANTDGIVILCPRDREEELAELVAAWEEKTKFKTEETRYRHLYSADVNNYIAIKSKDGSVKTKGRFAIAEPGKPPLMSKNPTGEIVVQAVIDHIKDGVPLSKTIKKCTDITKFVTVRTVQGGAIWSTGQDVVKAGGGEFLGKAIRWYYAKDCPTHIFYKKPNKGGNHNKVPKSDGARPLMELPEDFPEDIDYSRYISEANQVLREIAFHKIDI